MVSAFNLTPSLGLNLDYSLNESWKPKTNMEIKATDVGSVVLT